MRKITLLISSIALFCHCLLSQDVSSLKFDHITVDDGLSQNTVEKIFQDSQGFIWIATHDGLNKYDGSKFYKYRFDRTDTNSIASSWVSAIMEDASGNIWIGSLDGLNIFNPEKNKMARVKVDPSSPFGFKGGRIYDIEIDNDNSIWLGSENGLVHCIPERKQFITYQTGDGSTLTSNIVFDVLITKSNDLIIAVNDDPVFLFDRNKKIFNRIDYKQKYFGANYKKNLAEIDENEIFIASESGALHVYNLTDYSVKFIDSGPDGLNNITIKTAPEKISNGTIWIGTDGGGINIYNPIDESFSQLKFDPQNPNSISGGGIFDIHEDIHGNIWLGHFGTGISLLRKHKEKFKSYSPNPFDSLSITNGVVTSSYEDYSGRVWLGVDGGGLELFDPYQSAFSHYKHNPKNPNSLISNIVICIQEDDYGNLLLGTYQAGIMVFDPESRKMTGQLTTEHGLSSNNIWDIHKGSNGKYYFASLGMGIDIFDPADSSFEYLSVIDTVDPFFAHIPMFITEDNQGNFWFGSEGGGMAMYNFQNNESIVFKTNPDDLNSLSNNDVKCIQFLDNYAWIATNGGGLNRLNLKDYSFKAYTTREGMSSDALMGILIDKNNKLWISSVYGLMQFDPKNETITTFDKAQGLQSNEFKYNSQTVLSTGEMIFGGPNGISVFFPENIKPSPVEAPLLFTDLKIMNKSVDIQDKHSVLQKHINYTERIKLKHKHRVITFEFASLDYTSPAKNQYKYMLEGFDEKWIESGNQKYVTYTNLDPGSYTFRLKGSNSDGFFTDEERIIFVKTTPAWYASKAFIFTVIFLVIYIAYYFIKARDEKTKKDKVILQKKIEENKDELEKRIKEIEKQKNEIKSRDEQESEMKFLTEGLVKFGELITKHREDLSALSTELISVLVEYINGNSGIIFLSEENENKITLKKKGEYCFDSDLQKNEFEAGVGYIGTCFYEKRRIILDDIPDSFFVLSSGLGKIPVKHGVLIPIINDKECLGVIEIASIEKLPDHKVDFIEKIAETYASVVAVNNINEGYKKILEENNVQAQDLLAQKEEAHKKINKLQATQEISNRKEKQLEQLIQSQDIEIKELQKKIADIKGKWET